MQKGIVFNIQRMTVDDGPGTRTTVFFKGCPLSCVWCSNPESQLLHPQHMLFENLCTSCGRCEAVCTHGAITRTKERYFEKLGRNLKVCKHCGACAQVCPSGAAEMSGREYTAEEVMEVVRKDAGFYWRSGGGVTFGGGECTMQPDFLDELIHLAVADGLHICVDTCGYADPFFFKQIMKSVDLFLYDLKHMDSDVHYALTGQHNERILENLRVLLTTYPAKARIRIPLIPDLNDSEENIAAVASFLKEYGVAHVDIMPFHSFGKTKYDALMRTSPAIQEYLSEKLNEVLLRFARNGLKTELV